MTYPLPSPIHNVEDILFSKRCNRVSLQQHCFRGEGGANTKSQKFLHQVVGDPMTNFAGLDEKDSIATPCFGISC